MTPFGLFVRQKRAEKNIALKDMARAIGFHPSYLSVLELGKKGRLSDEILLKIAQFLSLNADEIVQLNEAARLSEKHIVIPDNAAPISYQLLHDFANAVDSLSSNDIEHIQLIIKKYKSTNGRCSMNVMNYLARK